MRTRRLAANMAVLASIVWLMAAASNAAAPTWSRVSARPPLGQAWVYWFVMDGNQSKEGITADFEALKRVGIGGVIFMEVDVGVPRGPVEFMSPQWREMFKHANSEGRPARSHDHHARQPRLDGQRRTVGEARAIDAEARHERNDRRGPCARSR